MAYSCKVLLDSVSEDGARLVTMCVTYPRFVHSELMTHRVFSRNAASSRAIPVEKMIQRVIEDPVLPVWWGKNQSGMQAKEELTGDALDMARDRWLRGRDDAVAAVQALMRVGLHKQIANRILEPWMWITVIVSATAWDNFFALRCHPDAQPELQKIAYMMRDSYNESKPYVVEEHMWHLPLVTGNDLGSLLEEGFTLDQMRDISVGRCARVSYLTHDGKRDPQKDIELAERLRANGHWSPHEHVAVPYSWPEGDTGNFRGWNQYRKYFPGENAGPVA